MLLTPTYHVFKMYKAHQGAASIPIVMAAPEYRLGQAAVRAVHASASRDSRGWLHFSLVNLDPNRDADLEVRLRGMAAGHAAGRLLTGPAINAINTFERPETVKPVPFAGVRLGGGRIELNLPAKSVVIPEIR